MTMTKAFVSYPKQAYCQLWHEDAMLSLRINNGNEKLLIIMSFLNVVWASWPWM
jgi:hypothetical protein